MLIDFFRDHRQKMKYFFENDQYHTTFSSNNNLAFSKRSYKDTVTYPHGLEGGEDAYICIASIRNKNRYFINKNIKIKHLPRPNLAQLSKQFYNYGRYFVMAIDLNKYKNMEIFYTPSFNYSYNSKHKSIKLKSPVSILLYFGSLHLLYLCLLLSILLPTYSLSLITLGLAIYFGHDLRLLPIGLIKTLQLSLTKFIVNNSLLLGNLTESIKRRKLIFMSNIEYSGDHELHFSKTQNFNHHNSSNSKVDIQKVLNKTFIPKELIPLGDEHYYFKYLDSYCLVKKRKFFIGYQLIAAVDKLENILYKKN